jgi:citrate synthase
MRIGKQDNPFSAISTATPERIVVRGRDLCDDIIGKVDFTSYFWLLVTGHEPSALQKRFADAVLAAIAEHGLVPSVVAARMTYAAAPEAFQGAVAAGLLGCGSVVLGSAEIAGRFLAEIVADGDDVEAAAARAVARLREGKKPDPRVGHPLHAGGDPRANKLIAMAKDEGAAGRHIAALDAVKAAIPAVYGRALPVNVNGAIPAVMLDVGFPLGALKGISLLARTASLIGHLQEETERPIGFILSGKAAEAIDYDGPEIK